MKRHSTLRLILAACLLAAATLSPVPAGEGLEPIQVLAPSDVPAPYSNGFGWSVDVSGNYIVVGAPQDPGYNGDATGAVYVFRRKGPTWIERAKLTVPDLNLVFQPQLGWSVAIDGDVIVAGAPAWDFVFCDARDPGAAYVFRRDDNGTPADPTDDHWSQEGELTLSDPVKNRGLGMSVAISGDVIVVGTDCGETAAVFRRTAGAWMHEVWLTASDAQPGDGFGSSVSVAGSVVAVAAPGDDYPCPDFDECHGSVYVFRGDDWTDDAKLVAAGVRGIGGSVSASVDFLATGGFGRAHLFRYNGSLWINEATLAPSDNVGQFGWSVSVEPEIVVVGALGNPWAYSFHVDGEQWMEADKLFGNGQSGRPVAIAGKYAAVATHIYAVSDHMNLRNFADLQNCFGDLPASCQGRACQGFDLVQDGRVDLDDFEEFAGTFVGP